MAEAAVEDPVISRFFCHKCSREISSVLPDFTCPNCNSGFIEELEPPPDLADDSDTEMDEVEPYEFNLRLGHDDFNLLLGGTDTRRPARGRARNGSDMHRSGRSTRGTRQFVAPPIENILHDFIMNLTGMGLGNLGGGQGTTPVVFLGNPGDYAWGREGLDAIVTQLLNQMDGTGPPPLSKDKIKEIPTVSITQDQVDKNLQCSVCWEDFRLGEPVRKLMCEHVYHDNCIIPWLELHGTCPICRKTLNDDSTDEPNQQGSGGNNVGPSLAALFRLIDQPMNGQQFM